MVSADLLGTARDILKIGISTDGMDSIWDFESRKWDYSSKSSAQINFTNCKFKFPTLCPTRGMAESVLSLLAE